MAASTIAIDRSAVFIVPINHTISDNLKSSSELCSTAI